MTYLHILVLVNVVLPCRLSNRMCCIKTACDYFCSLSKMVVGVWTCDFCPFSPWMEAHSSSRSSLSRKRRRDGSKGEAEEVERPGKVPRSTVVSEEEALCVCEQTSFTGSWCVLVKIRKWVMILMKETLLMVVMVIMCIRTLGFKRSRPLCWWAGVGWGHSIPASQYGGGQEGNSMWVAHTHQHTLTQKHISITLKL